MESNAASKLAANRIPVKCLECVSYNMSDISRIGSPMYLSPTKADCSLEISKGINFSIRFVKTLLITLVSTLIKLIGLQAFINLTSLPGF